jgi:hypothetical protein
MLYTTIWTLDAISEMSLRTEKWIADPRGLLTQLELWEETRWGDRIRGIREEIKMEI